MVICKDHIRFFELQAEFDRIPFSQSEAWYHYIRSQGKEVILFMDKLEFPTILTWGFIENVPVFRKKILRIEGECYRKESGEAIQSFYKALRNLDYAGIELNSNTVYDLEFEICLRRAGFLRPIGSFSCPLTIEIDLEGELDPNRNWKRNVKLAERNNLKCAPILQPTPEIVNEIVSMFTEMAELKKLGYQLSAKSIQELMQSPSIRTLMVSNEDGTPIAARIIHIHEKYASDVFAANSNLARDCGATFFLMQYIFETLKDEGLQYFDFGRIPPSNHASDNVYVFKNSARGKKIQYNGEWCSYRSKSLELSIFIYKWFKLKKQRY